MPLFAKRKAPEVDIDKDFKAVSQFLNDITENIEEIKLLLFELYKLRSEALHLRDQKALKVNVQQQIELYDELLLKYSYFDQDVSINGIRVKNAAPHYIQQANEHRFYTLLERMKKESHWL